MIFPNPIVQRTRLPLVGILVLAASTILAGASHAADPPAVDLFARDNLVAWCIVPFDAKKRGPEERVAMLKRLGFKRFAYDWRGEHLPTFDQEVGLLKKEGIELTAVWFPANLGDDARKLLAVIEKHKVRPQLWVTMTGGGAAKSPEEQRQKVASHARTLRPLAEAAAKLGCSVALYNHGDWFGEPENQIAILDALHLPERRHRLQPAPRTRPPRPFPGASQKDEAALAGPEPERHGQGRR